MLLSALLLAPFALPQTPRVVPDMGPGGAAEEELLASQRGGAVPDGDPDGVRVPGQALPAGSVGPVRIEGFDVVRERERASEPAPGIPRLRNGRQGHWYVPSIKERTHPSSGEHCIVNRWGDTSMGIGLGAPVDVVRVQVARHGGQGIEARAVRVLGFRDGVEVARTPWFEDVDETPSPLEIGFEAVDRIVVEARPGPTGAGFYALDDLVLVAGEQGERVLDFDDLDWGASLRGAGYGGLTWEEGTGSFEPPKPRIVPAPQEAGGGAPAPAGAATDAATGGSSTGFLRGGSGTAPTLVTEFRGPRLGDPGAGWIPPDTCGAVGRDHYCAIVNQHLSVYEKGTQNRVVSTSLQSFFGVGGSCGDPRIAYDFADDRWVIVATDFGELLYFAYSLTPDPTGAWLKTSIDLVEGADAGRWIDYPTLGVDSRGVFVEAYMVGSPATMSIFAVDKAPLLAATPGVGTVTAFRSLSWNGAIHHACQYTDAGTSWMISTGSSSTLRLRRIDPPMTSPTLTSSTVAIPGFSAPPDAPASGSTVDISTGGTRLMNAAYAAGSIWTAHAVSSGGRAAARWYQVDPVGATLVQSGTVDDPSLHFYYPSIAADADGYAVLGFSGSDAGTFPGCYVTGRIPTDPAGQMAPPVQYAAGLASYTLTDGGGRNRWGDYSNTSLDPVDGSFWTIQERTGSSANSWVTHVAQLEHDRCFDPSNFCFSLPTPSGPGATMGWAGSPSVSANDLQLLASNVPPLQFGLFFYSRTQSFTSLGGGILCLGQPLYRIAPVVQASVFGFANLTLDVTSPLDPAGQILAGDTWHFSFWFREPSPSGFNFADGLTVTFCD